LEKTKQTNKNQTKKNLAARLRQKAMSEASGAPHFLLECPSSKSQTSLVFDEFANWSLLICALALRARFARAQRARSARLYSTKIF